MIEFKTSGMFEENTFVVGNEAECWVIDPGAPADEVLKMTGARTIKGILLTHTHMDHIMGVDELRDRTRVKLYVPIGEKHGLGDPRMNLSSNFGADLTRRDAEETINEGDQFSAGNIVMTALFTPGHSPGHLVFAGDGFVIAGDTLFAGSIGRSDFPHSSHSDLMASIKNKLMTMADATVVYPGHGPKTTIGTERQFNPFLAG